jgi:hypothetical protein
LKKIVKREKATSTKGHYVTNADLLPAVLEAKKLGRVTDKLAKMLLLIAERYSRKSWFSGYSYREDMVSVAVVNLCNNALKFNPETSKNPFAYYTTAIHRSFQNYKSDEKKHRNIRDALLLDAGANPSFNFLDQEQGHGNHDDHEHHHGHSGEAHEPAPEVEAPPTEAKVKRGRPPRPAVARPTVRAESHNSSEVKVWKPGTFTTDEAGNISFIDPTLQRVKKGADGELIITAGRVPKVAKKPVKKAAVKKAPVKKVTKKLTKAR